MAGVSTGVSLLTTTGSNSLVAWFDFPTSTNYQNAVDSAQQITGVSGLQTTTQEVNSTLGSHHSETYPTTGFSSGHPFNYSTNPINVTNSFSVCFWRRQNSAMSFGAPSDYTSVIGIDIDQIAIVAYGAGDIAVIENGIKRADAVISINTWDFVVVTFENTSSNNYTTKIYLNGASTPAATSSSFTRSWSSNALRSFGGYQRSAAHVTPITLKIDSLGIYNKILSSAEMAYLYNSGSGRTFADTLK